MCHERLSLELGDGLALGEGIGKRFPGNFVEFRFVVEGLKVRGAACHAEVDHALCFGRMVWGSVQAGVALPRNSGLGELRCKRGGSQGEATFRKKCAPLDVVGRWIKHCQEMRGISCESWFRSS